MKFRWMSFFIILLMILQIAIVCHGIDQLFHGDYLMGAFNVVWNSIFYFVNVNTLKKLKRFAENEKKS